MNTRATCLNCMDGRTQLPVINWIRKKYQIAFVDVITEAGMDWALASKDSINEILRSINISIKINKSTIIFVVGHYDCRGNPVNKEAHCEHIAKALKRLKEYFPKIKIVGLWVNRRWQVEVAHK